MNGSFSRVAWKTVEPILERIKTHPFPRKLANGTLSREMFMTYIRQDSFYLHKNAEETAIVADMLPEGELKEIFRKTAVESIPAEKEMHAMLGIRDDEEIRPMHATSGYLAHIRGIIDSGDLAMSLAAILPCQWVYDYIGRYIHSIEKTPNPFHEWICCYTTEAMERSTLLTIELTDALAMAQSQERQEKMLDAFVKSTQWEYEFWDQAYRAHSHKDTQQ